MTAKYDWGRVRFFSEGERPWTLAEVVAFARRVEDIAEEERKRAEKAPAASDEP